MSRIYRIMCTIDGFEGPSDERSRSIVGFSAGEMPKSVMEVRPQHAAGASWGWPRMRHVHSQGEPLTLG